MPIATPIPQKHSGFLLGSPLALVNIEAFVDIQCPHSRAAWPTLLAVLEHYKKQPVNLNVHVITLSNHRQAWDMSLGLLALAEGNAQVFCDFATLMYKHQADFYNAPYHHKTHNDLQHAIAKLAKIHAETHLGIHINEIDFIGRMNNSDIYTQARTPIRYAATKGVWATPTFFVNGGCDVPVNHASDIIQWKAMIDPLLALNR